MTEFDPVREREQTDDTSTSPIQVDIYGLKLQGTPGKPEPRPKTWREVGHRLHQHLMTICERSLGLVADTFDAAGNIIRGLGAVPGAIATRIRGDHQEAIGAHQEADEREARQQSQVIASDVVDEQPPAISHETPIQEPPSLEEVLDRYHAQGFAVQVVEREDGVPVLMIVKPGDADAVARFLIEEDIDQDSEPE